jgi:hypothetical protein
MKRIRIGSRVRIAGRAALHAAKDLRPEPGQMLWAGRESSVTGYRRSPDDHSLYALKGAPGLWLEEWIDPI